MRREKRRRLDLATGREEKERDTTTGGGAEYELHFLPSFLSPNLVSGSR